VALLRYTGVLLTALLLPVVASNQEARPEFEVKAAYLYQFAILAEWPAAAFATTNAPLTIAVLGEDPFGEYLDKLGGKVVNGHPVAVRRFAQVVDVERCHVLYLSKSEMERAPAPLGAVGAQPILTVGEGAEFARRGGIIGFMRVGENIKFAINLEAAARAQIRLSPKLLRLATIVKPGEPEKGQ
jgi:hypothetical protein